MNKGKPKYKSPLLVLILSFFISLTLFNAQDVSATTYDRPITLENLIQDSQWIVLAKVKKIRSTYTSLSQEAKKMFQGRHDKIITSTIDLEIQENYKGDLNRSFQLNVEGGCVLDVCYQNSLFPVAKFRAGKQVVLFLEKPGLDNIKITYGDLGVWRLNPDQTFEGKKMTLADLREKIRSLNLDQVSQSGQSENIIPVDQFGLE